MMQRYNYEYDDAGSRTTRVPGEMFPDYNNILSNGIAYNVSIGNLFKKLRKALEGVAEGPTILIEEQWWVEQNKIQELESLVLKISELTKNDKTDTNGVIVPLTKEELASNLYILNLLLLEYDVADQTMLLAEVGVEITIAIRNRDIIEDGVVGETKSNLWLKLYRGVVTSTPRPKVSVVIPKNDLKKLVAYERNKSIRNTEDTLADLAKMNSLLFSMVTTIYGTLTPTAKNKIPAVERGIIEHATTRFTSIQTRADRQLAMEGTTLIDKLLDREVAIADLIDALMK